MKPGAPRVLHAEDTEVFHAEDTEAFHAEEEEERRTRTFLFCFYIYKTI